MARVIINPEEANGFLRSFHQTTESIDTSLDTVKNNFETNCASWQDQSRADFEAELHQIVGETKRFIQETEEYKDLLRRLIASAEEIASIRIRIS